MRSTLCAFARTTSLWSKSPSKASLSVKLPELVSKKSVKVSEMVTTQTVRKMEANDNMSQTVTAPVKEEVNAYQDVSGTQQTSTHTARLQFSVGHEAGQLKKYLDILVKHQLNMVHIESQPTPVLGEYNIFVDVSLGPYDLEHAQAAVKEIQQIPNSEAHLLNTKESTSIWFPRRMADLDTFAAKVMAYGAELDADHPGFKDEAYRKRRAEIVAKAREYKTGMPLPHIEYTEEETQTWATVYNKLKQLYPLYACKQHRFVFPLLEAKCGYSATKVPQLQDVSDFLQSATGWRLRPVMGLLSARDFLNGLAFRVFHSTQYMRHPSMPLYTPEPDLCHELLGHVPLYADPAFAEFSQEIGMASLGASDDEIQQLSAVYWFTVEFGVCREDGEIKAYGAGLLSSFGELEYSCKSGKPEMVPFDPWVAAITKYPITTYQPKYFVANSFRDATERVRRFAQSLSRANTILYDPYTMTMRVIDNKNAVRELANQIKNETAILHAALEKL